jgi:hypothetical protein
MRAVAALFMVPYPCPSCGHKSRIKPKDNAEVGGRDRKERRYSSSTFAEPTALWI